MWPHSRAHRPTDSGFISSRFGVDRWTKQRAVAGAVVLLLALVLGLTISAPATKPPASHSASVQPARADGPGPGTPTPSPSATTSTTTVPAMPPPVTTSTVPPTPASSPAVPVPQESSSGEPGDSWWQTAECEESGNNDPTYGYFGIYPSTWASYGGTQFAPTAGGATYAEQEQVGMAIEGRPPDPTGECLGPW